MFKGVNEKRCNKPVIEGWINKTIPVTNIVSPDDLDDNKDDYVSGEENDKVPPLTVLPYSSMVTRSRL
jgi:hypothetical protein